MSDFNSALSDFVFQSKYSKFIPELGKKETYEMAVDRIVKMHMTHLSRNYPHALENSDFCDDFLQAVESYQNKRVFGSQRALQFGGEPILKRNERLFNCSFSYCDRIEVFKEIEWLLLAGCGVGVSVEFKHVNKLPKFVNKLSTNSYQHVVEDTCEGWALAVDALIRYYLEDGCAYPIFDFSQIRPKGAPISHGFLAPGPKGLKKSLQKINDILDKAYKENVSRRLLPVEIADIIAYEADSILSGGVRRSAVSILFSPEDELMFNAKIGNWWYENPQRGRYNASAVLERGETMLETYERLFRSTKEYGEPGFVWRSDPLEGFNPCFEIGFKPLDKEGRSGWQLCNLVSISGKEMTHEDYFFKACKDAATIATIQATYMKFPFLGEITESIVAEDPLIGVSISGIMTNPDILLDESILELGAEIVKEQNEKIANILGINKSSRCTCIKPKILT